MNRTLAAVAAILLALLSTACGQASNPSSSGRATSPSPPPAVAPSRPAVTATPDLFPSSPEALMALIPDEVGDVALQKLSMRGNEFVSSGSATEETQQFLSGIGVSADQVAVAAGFGASADTSNVLVVFIFRAEGATTDRLVQGFKDATQARREAPMEWRAIERGGKRIEMAADPAQANQAIYLYASGDVLVFVAATDEAQAAEALAAIP
jgi:hypothetical protein